MQGISQRFDEWVRDHGKAVRGFVLCWCGGATWPTTSARRSFAERGRGVSVYAEQGKTRPYLLQIANRLVVDRSRRSEPRSNLDDEVWKACEPPCPGPDPSQAAERNEQVRLLHAALDRLAPMQQRVLLLRYFGQMEFQEIADTLQTPLNTAPSHCRRGLESLRKLLVETES